MSCTTLLVGKNASYDGSTMIARNDDSGANVMVLHLKNLLSFLQKNKKENIKQLFHI